MEDKKITFEELKRSLFFTAKIRSISMRSQPAEIMIISILKSMLKKWAISFTANLRRNQ